MTKINMLTFIIIIAFNISCNQEIVQNQNSKTNLGILKTISDTSKFTIIEFNEAEKWVFSKNCRKTNLTKDDLDNIAILLNEKVQEFNIEAKKRLEELKNENKKIKFDRNQFVIDLNNYKRQYVAVINQNNEKEVWINCFCGDWGENRKKNIVIVEDGGNCYFNLKINLTTKKCYDFIVNGDA